MIDVVAALDRRTDGRLSWVLSVALAGAATGLVLGAGFSVVVAYATGLSGAETLLVALVPGAAVGGFVASGTCWWAVVERSGSPGWLRGAVAGVASGLVAHPVMWSAIVFAVAVAPTVDATRTPSASLTSATLELARVVAIATAASLLVLGWLTAVAGGTLGALLGRRRARVTAE